MFEAIIEAQGKPGCDLRALFIGTLAPAMDGWWHDLVKDGSHDDTYVVALLGDRSKWDRVSEIRRVNPLLWKFPESRRLLLQRRDKARSRSAARARFLSFRLNAPSLDDAQVLLDVETWDLVLARPVPDPAGRPVVGIDLGGARAWSAAVAVWPNGRVEAVAVAPGVPEVSSQERQDRAPISVLSMMACSASRTGSAFRP